MAIATFRQRQFQSAVELAKFVTTDPGINAIVSITFDPGNGRFVVFYTTT